MTNKQRKMKPTVRDRGYAWVIVVAAFLLQAINGGVRFSYGLYFVEFLNEFNKGKGQTAWVGSIMQSVFNLEGASVQQVESGLCMSRIPSGMRCRE
ncbi:monocarboxylate transporter 9-like [Mercenaria mercenaria]|uniref:monocarboxylate transporter 9-like n=1 Tax=Mercenaria mercenaria TaxID=6596 RepID=UPI00234E81BE|nr:monocarboxylate transporter 9-like [Mercenaria mercenaria]